MSTTYLKSLFSIAPGFKNDRDEEWMPYLTSEKQNYLRQAREKFLLLNEKLDDLKLRSRTTGGKTSSVNPLVKQTTSDLDNLMKQLLPKIPTLRAQAVQRRKELVAREIDNAGKRRRLDQEEEVTNLEDIDFTDNNLELIADDVYLPSHLTDRRNKTTPSTATKKPTSVPASIFEPVQEAPKAASVEHLVKDISPDDAKIVVQLKSIIQKYDCRDRVLEALARFRKRDNTLEALAALKKYVAQYKKEDKQKKKTTTK